MECWCVGVNMAFEGLVDTLMSTCFGSGLAGSHSNSESGRFFLRLFSVLLYLYKSN